MLIEILELLGLLFCFTTYRQLFEFIDDKLNYFMIFDDKVSHTITVIMYIIPAYFAMNTILSLFPKIDYSSFQYESISNCINESSCNAENDAEKCLSTDKTALSGVQIDTLKMKTENKLKVCLSKQVKSADPDVTKASQPINPAPAPAPPLPAVKLASMLPVPPHDADANLASERHRVDIIKRKNDLLIAENNEFILKNGGAFIVINDTSAKISFNNKNWNVQSLKRCNRIVIKNISGYQQSSLTDYNDQYYHINTYTNLMLRDNFPGKAIDFYMIVKKSDVLPEVLVENCSEDGVVSDLVEAN